MVQAAWGLNAFWTTVANTVISYGISIVTNKLFGPKSQSQQYQNSTTECNSNNIVPMIYGRMRCGGNITWNSYGNTNYVERLVSFGDGPISGISGVCFSDMLVNNGPVMQVRNTLYADATIQIYQTNSPTANDKLLTLHANGTNISIILAGTVDNGYNGMQNYNCFVADLMSYINNLGNGWVAIASTGSSTSDSCENIWPINTVSCYNSNIAFNINGISGCSYTVYTGDGIQTIDSRVPGNTQIDKAKVVGGLRHEAYIACTAQLSSSLSGSFNVTAIVDGRLVRIYTTTTAYTIAWSDNPAWCILDYMTAYNGCYTPFTEMDIQSFITAAAYFNVVANGYSRFSLNRSIDNSKSHQDWLTEMLKTCRSWLTYTNGKYGILVEKVESVSQIFTLGASEQWETWWPELIDEVDIVKVKYTDPGYEWTAVAAQARLPVINRSPAQEKIIDIAGITIFEQASAMAWFALNQEVDCPQWAIWHSNKRVVNRTIGDVIQITDPTGMTKKWRIMSIKGTNKKEITMREYNENLYSDTLGSVKSIPTITKLTNPFATPPDATSLILTQNYYHLKDSTVISTITGSCTLPSYVHLASAQVDYSIDAGTTWVYGGATDNYGNFVISNAKTLVTYIVRVRVENKMQVLSSGLQSSVYITGKDAPPSDVSGFIAVQDTNDSTKINLSWTPATDIDLKGYQIFLLDTAITDIIFSNKYSYTLTVSDSYTFQIKAIDWSGNYSTNFATYTLSVSVEPASVTGFQVLQNGNNVLCSWVKNLESNVTGYEIREGAVFDNGALMGTGITGITYTIPVDTNVTKQYWIKAINSSGKYSVNASSSIVTIANIIPKNIIVDYDEITLANGTHSNTKFGPSSYTCLTFPGKCSDYPNLLCSAVGGISVLQLITNTAGTYLIQRKDMGKIMSANITSNFVSNILLNGGLTAKLQFRQSLDNVLFSAWADFQPITATFRYLDFQVLLSTIDITRSPEINMLQEHIDVPDQDKYGTATIAVGGTTVPYGYTYQVNPSVLPSAIGTGLAAQIVSIGLSSFVVRVVNGASVDVGGTVTWFSKGY